MGVVYVIKVFKLKLPPSIEQTVGTCTGVFAKDYMVYKKKWSTSESFPCGLAWVTM